MSKYEIHRSDITQWLRDYIVKIESGEAKRFHAILSDPPYFLDSVVKRFGKKDASPAKFGTDGAFSRQSHDFIGRTWDSFQTPQHYQSWIQEWAELMLQVVYPNSVALFFSGSRTSHRLACGLEDAGWELFDQISTWSWVYGSGMPHGYNLQKGMAKSKDDEIAASANNWADYNTALKPSHEPIILARAPRGSDTYIDRAHADGVGMLNIGGLYLPVEQEGRKGRYPANSVFVHHPECDDSACHPSCHVKMLAEQSGNRRAGGNVTGNEPSETVITSYNEYGRKGWSSYNDKGTATRFFYTPKSPSWERSAGLESRCIHGTMKPIKLTEMLGTMVLPPETIGERRLLVPFSGVGSEMIGSMLAGWDRITGVELDHDGDYIPQAKKRLEWWSENPTYELAAKKSRAERKASSKS